MIDTLLSLGGDKLIGQLAGQFGLNADQVGSAIKTLAPALAGGLKERLTAGGATDLLAMLQGPALTGFVEDPASLATPQAASIGDTLLSKIFGGGDLGGLVSMAAEKTGLGGGVLQSMLPVVMTLVGGFISKQAAGKSQDEIVDMLGALSGEGGILGAVKGLAAKIFG
jgi:hypothetical protein